MSQIVLSIRPTSELRGMNAQTALGLTNGPQWQLDIEPIGKNAQIALALTKGKVACVCAHQWTHPVLELVRNASFHATETKHKWAASAKQRRNREDPQNKSFLTAARNAPPGEGNGTPLRYSCLENPMDSRVWWAAVPQPWLVHG